MRLDVPDRQPPPKWPTAMLRYGSALAAVIAGTTLLSAQPLPDLSQAILRECEAKMRGCSRGMDADSSHSYDMLSLTIDYRIELQMIPASGMVSLQLAVLETQDSLKFNAESLIVSGVNYYDQALPFVHRNDTVYVEFHVEAGDTVTLDFNVAAPPQDSYSDQGYVFAWDHAFTFAEPYGARRWFPCFDQPFDKINSVSIALNLPDPWRLAANGALIEESHPEPGRIRQVYRHDYPISTYLVMMAASDYWQHTETVDGVLYRYYAFPRDSALAAYDWQRTPQMVAVFNDLFGPYPFSEYGMVQAHLLNGWGAMEHQTFTTMGTHLVNGMRSFEPVVAHELAHQWFGNDLTLVDFRNIWLNEGFATYAAALFYEADSGDSLFQSILNIMADSYFNEDRFIRYAVYDPPPSHLFGSAVYNKGGWILHMLRKQILGDSLFFETLRNYVTAFRAGSVSTDDFISVVNNTSGLNLRWFFDQWVFLAGHPVLEVTISARQPTDHDVTVSIRQVQSNAPLFRFPLNVEVITAEGAVTRPFWFSQQTESVILSFPGLVDSARLAMNQPLIYEGPGASAPPPRGHEPLDFALGHIYPNPLNSSARIPFYLASATQARLTVCDVTGRQVSELANRFYAGGAHEIEYSPPPATASGIYFVSLEARGSRRLAKLVLIR